ncbi:hypothetical protein [Chitinimonas sp.]|uniref:hypothetical protein n=1 Tax=Chitinimonas sp. TaxID=1934313 RepID=UPI0035B2A18D
MSQEKFDQLVSLYRAINFQQGSRDGDLTIADEAQRSLLLNLLDDCREFGLSLPTGEITQVIVGGTLRLRADDPRTGIGLLADTFDDVLKFRSGRIKTPRYYLLDAGWAVGDTDPPDLVSRYAQVLALIDLLGESAAYLDKEAQALVFVDEGRFSMPILYEAKDLLALDVTSLESLLGRLGQDTHRDQKLAILAKAVQAICTAAVPVARFVCLLQHLPELLKQFDEGYRLFVADFSYEKILNQMEEAKLEELAKIHKTFSDIQNQILGIPVATIIVATQLKQTQKVDAVLWVNSAILVGVWVFAILTWLVLRNQRHTLDAIEEEIRRKLQKIEADYSAIKDSVTSTFPALNKRLRAQRIAFCAVDSIVVVGVILAHVIYFAMTDPAYAMLAQIPQKLISLF